MSWGGAGQVDGAQTMSSASVVEQQTQRSAPGGIGEKLCSAWKQRAHGRGAV